MIYDLSKELDKQDFKFRSNHLFKKGEIVELTEKRKKRSITQNAYLHVCISYFGIEFGYSIDETKTLLKRNCDFMVYEKKNQKFLRKTSLMDSKELTSFIEWIRNFAGVHGLYIPTANEYDSNTYEIEKAIQSHKEHL